MIRLWKHLHEKKTQETDAEKSLRKKYNAFLMILSENEHALDLMATLENKFFNQQIISLPYLKNTIRNFSRHVANAVEGLIQLSGGNYRELRNSYTQLESEIRTIVTGQKEPIYTPIVIPMDAVKKELVDKVGSKMANLGELRDGSDFRVPEGFAATACAFTQFIEFNNLTSKIARILWHIDPADSQQLLTAETAVKQLFLDAQIPAEIEYAIRAESEKIEQARGKPVYWAVRSSAIGEDLAESSFAGQFSTVLNVRSDQLLEKYREVIASKYNARAMIYKRMKNIRDDDVSMSVGFMEMIDPVCSGVLYSANPVNGGSHEMVVNAVWGLGELLVEGVVSADVYVLKREPGFPLVKEDIADKEVCLTRLKEGGLRHEVMVEQKACRRCLTDGQLRRLARMGLEIEAHFKSPQDIEWCIDQENNLYVLQSRPLHVFESVDRCLPSALNNAPVIARNAQPVSPGIGCGRVFKAVTMHDLGDLRKGEVLVLKNSSPRFIGALRKASVVIVEKGNWTDHMASVVREFRVPCVVRVPGIFDRLHNGQEITVAAAEGMIYDGGILNFSEEKSVFLKSDVDVTRTESHRLLEKMAPYIFHLNLADPRNDNFTVDGCRTWHDILRFCHETALNEMFLLREKSRIGGGRNVFRVNTDAPVNLYVLDILGNTVSFGESRRAISPENVHSLPFQALWKGMGDSRLCWSEPHPSATVIDFPADTVAPVPEGEKPVDTNSYAVVTPTYLNLSLNMASHYVVLDCYLSDDVFNNYISLSFKGGASGAKRENRRIAFVAGIMKKMEFNVAVASNFLTARIKAESGRNLAEKIQTIGRMVSTTHLPDRALAGEERVDTSVAQFFNCNQMSEIADD